MTLKNKLYLLAEPKILKILWQEDIFVPKKGVGNWLKDAKEMIREAQVVENKVSNGRYLCRACNEKLVDEKSREMQEYLDKAPKASEGLAMDGPSAGLPLETSELVGEEAVRKEIWACLMQEEHIHNDLLKEQRFERVVWVTISKEFNIVKLQNDIASALNRKMPEEANKRAGKHVLILDDVWSEVSLEEIGIPKPSSSNGYKLVLTTRVEQVCKSMGCKVIKLKPLSEEEALILFLSEVGPNIVQNQTLMPTLKLVVKDCAGLPLTIVVIAGTLRGEDDPLIWKNTLRELKERIGKVKEGEDKVIKSLKVSFNHLKDEKMKHCFLHCALYPEDIQIWKDGLIECWIEEGFIDDMRTRQEMKDKGHVILKKLEDNCLLENVSCEKVKMHDAVRDMALSITRMNPRYMIQAGSQLEELPEKEQWSPDIEKVSLMYNSISEISIDHNPIKKIPCSFFINMPCLCVLNLSYTEIKSLPNSISELKNLTTLLLCDFPEGIDMLIKLRYLDLRVPTLKEIPTGLLPKLVHLQRLSFDEMEPLKKLECFTRRFEDINEFNKFISSMQQSKKNLIKDKTVTVGGVKNWEGELIMHPIEIQQNIVDDNSSFKNEIDLRCVVSLSSFASSSAHPFQSLEVLDLGDLPKLSALIMKDAGIGLATTSTLAPIYKCLSMKTLLPHWLLPNLQNLEEIPATSEVEEKGSDALIKFHLPKLRELEFKSGVMCDKLKRIPPFIPLVGNGQPFACAPPSLTIKSSTEWWESLEWDDHPNFKNVLRFNPPVEDKRER
ncbi:hypothetical protein V6Z11_D05G394100 [Gossypium hirsutum]